MLCSLVCVLPLPSLIPLLFSLFFFNDTATTEIYTLSLHDALPISTNLILNLSMSVTVVRTPERTTGRSERSEEHTSELQSHSDLVCRLLLEKKKKKTKRRYSGVSDHPNEAATRDNVYCTMTMM